METVKPTKSFCGRAALLATACLIAPVKGGETRMDGGIASREAVRRGTALMEAQELLKKGDEAYLDARYGDAVEAYTVARDQIPDAPVSAALRAAATDRLAQASVEHARVLSRKGDVAGARSVMDKVLDKNVAPEHAGALAFRAQLDDPIRTNPALTAEHAKEVDAVRRLLYAAEGAFNLGKFDQAGATYEEVLRIDPTNSAARRGMERTAAAKSGYAGAAYDHTRAEMLAEVDRQWELQVPPAAGAIPGMPDPGSGVVDTSVSVRDKLERIIIPSLALDQVTLDEALDFLRVRSAENDTLAANQASKGVNFTVNLGPPDSEPASRVKDFRFDLRLKQVPLGQALKYITEVTQTSYSTDDYSVIIRPLGSSSGELVAETYRVPADFLSTLSSGAAESAQEDPFATPSEGGGILAKRMGAMEALKAQGVSFPEGASASYLGASNTLRVVNTRANQDYIAQIIDTIRGTEPVVCAVKVTMIKVQQTQLEELGFDWILNNYGFGGPAWVPGQDRLNLGGGTVGNGAPMDDIEMPNNVYSRNPITAGNRSGDFATSGDSLDSLLDGSTDRQSRNRAPGVLGLRGHLDQATVQALMRGLNQKKGVDLLAQPTAVTRSGQASSIELVREFIYPTEYEPPELPNSTGDTLIDDGFGGIIGGGGGGQTPVTPSTPTAFDMRKVGITLEVLPVVDANKQYVNVTLTPSITDFDGFVNFGSPINSTSQGTFDSATVSLTDNSILMPVFSRQSVTTNIDVADGGTVFVGGLMQDAKQIVEDKTPILGSIPVIGRLFQSDVNQTTSTVVLFLVNVELMDPTGRRFRER